MSETESHSQKMKLFWACFVALVATSFFFGLRGVVAGQMAGEFKLSMADLGGILGVGLWPFAFSIIFFSLIIDKIGYKPSAYFAIIVHTIAVIGTLVAVKNGSANWLWWSTFLVALANGTVEAFINPVVATIFPKEKTKWLNILHAGWPAGLALGAAAGLLLGGNSGLMLKFGICLIPVILYAFLTIPCKFPIQERVAAGVSYRDMLKEVGAVGFFLIAWLIVLGISQMLGMGINQLVALGIAAVVAVIAGIYTKSAGNWMFLLILFTMPFLATTELGTDGWMSELLAADFPKAAGWIFVMISVIMTILRFYAGPIVHAFSPIGLLVVSAILAIAGLFFLGVAPSNIMIVAAIVYAFGKTFLWSTTLGVVAERFPKGGALTLNGVSGVGVLGMGLLGSPLFMGSQLDKNIDANLQAEAPAIHQKISGAPKELMFMGESPTIDPEKVETLSEEESATYGKVVNGAKKRAFYRQAILPAVMLVCYLILWIYFKSRGGYKPAEIGDSAH